MNKQKELDAINSLLFCGNAYIEKYGHDLILDKDEIFHYTDLNGLKGILEGRGFWLSEAEFLNDEEELRNGIKLTKNLIDKLILEDKYSSFKEILLETSNKLEEYDYTDNYIASFSLKSDDLEQWRAYSNNGNGICIGLDIKKETIYPHFRWGATFNSF